MGEPSCERDKLPAPLSAPAQSPALALCAEVPATSLLAGAAPTFYWSQQGVEAAFFGEAERREGGALGPLLRSLETGLRWVEPPPALPPGPWFGAIAFDGCAGPDWSGFAPVRFSLPRLLRWSQGGRSYAAVFGGPSRGALEARLDEARRALEFKAARAPQRVRVLPGARAGWDALVARALGSIARGELAKIVLARTVEAVSEEAIPVPRLLEELARRNPSCTTYLLRGDDGAAFLGATPELFCRLEGRRIFADALAGSAPPGQGAALLASRKDLREHQWVVDHLSKGLRPLCAALTVPAEPRVRALANVAHLHTAIEGTLREGVNLAEVIAALHPTPAVLGVPSPAARSFLSAHEGLSRGLYAGLVGLVGPGRAEFAVALRCALVRGRSAQLFVGAGIVEGSTAAGEWDETALKASALLDALGAAP